MTCASFSFAFLADVDRRRHGSLVLAADLHGCGPRAGDLVGSEMTWVEVKARLAAGRRRRSIYTAVPSNEAPERERLP